MSGSELLGDVLRKKAMVDAQLGDLARQDARLGLNARAFRTRTKADETASATNNTTNTNTNTNTAMSSESAPVGDSAAKPSRSRVALESDATSVERNKRVFGSLLLGTLRGAKQEIATLSDAAKRRAEIESKISESLAHERSNSVEVQRRKLQQEAQALANEAALIERAARAPLVAKHEAALVHFRKTTTLPVIYWCTRAELDDHRARERARREADAESGEELGANEPSSSTTLKRKERSSADAADGDDGNNNRDDKTDATTGVGDDAAAARGDERASKLPRRASNAAFGDEDDLETDAGEGLSVTFD
jgi:hypothetical protein